MKTRLDAEATKRIAAEDERDAARQRELRAVRRGAEERAETRQKNQEALGMAAFDGDVAQLEKCLARGASVLRPDDQGNYALGEAAVNGQGAIAKILLDAGADPNSKGEYGRTPLWRAAFNSHADAIQVLLEHGADPRIAAQSQLPAELASGAAKTALAAWDVAKTDALKAAQQRRTDDVAAAKAREVEQVAAKHEAGVAQALDVLKAAQREAKAARQELEERIIELDLANQERGDGAAAKAKIALECVQDCEGRVAEHSVRLEDATREFLKLRAEQKAEVASAAASGLDEADFDHPIVEWGEIGALSHPDWARRVSVCDTRGAHWPVLIDVSGKAPVFFRYRDANYVDTFRPRDLEPDALRRALIGSLRYGKALVVDLRDACMWHFVEEAFDAVRPGLWAVVLDGAKLRAQAAWEPLIRPEDGPRYHVSEWREPVTAEATIVFLTSASAADELAPAGVFPVRTPT
jgi:hypothetical protein